MAVLVGQHQQTSFTQPVNTPGVGDALDASVVRGNDNTLRTTYNAHDNDTTIHMQSGITAERPAYGNIGSVWLDRTTGLIYFDTGSAWSVLGYTTGAVPADQYFYLADTRI